VLRIVDVREDGPRFVELEFILRERRGVMVNCGLRAPSTDEPDLKWQRDTACRSGTSMAVQRKIFRIEQSVYHLTRDRASALEPGVRPPQPLAPELEALRARIAQQSPVPREAMERARAQIAEAEAYKQELDLIHAAVSRTKSAMDALGGDAAFRPDAGRIARELAAIVADTERAAHAILLAAEDIDRSAAEMAAGVEPRRERELANDIRCHVGQVLEACGIHDLTGQRVARVQATLASIEAHIARLSDIWSGVEVFKPVQLERAAEGDRRLLNGPKLDGDGGHYTQDEVDGVFGCA
jgi:chemotaxis protein CheZ